MKLDQLAAFLYQARTLMGNCEVAIHDADTGEHLQIQNVRQSTKSVARLLIEGDYDQKCESTKSSATGGL